MKQFQDMFKDARRAHETATTADGQLRPLIMGCADAVELADAAYALREAEGLLDDARKKLKELKSLADKMACLVAATTLEGECIRTEYCTAVPMQRSLVRLPTWRKDPEQYRELMTFLGVPAELQGGGEDRQHAAVEMHWPGMMELMHRRMAEGKPLPPGVDPGRTTAEYSLTIRKKKGVTE
jgi:hypothetical protein